MIGKLLFSLMLVINLTVHGMEMPKDKPCSANLQSKLHIMQCTSEHIQYEFAKRTHAQFNTPDTEYIVKICAEELTKTQAFKNFAQALAQEENQPVIQPTSYRPIRVSDKEKAARTAYAEKVKNRVDSTREVLEHTPEYQQVLFARINYIQHKNAQTRSAFKKAKYTLKNTPQVLEYCKAKDEARRLLTQMRSHELVIIEPNYPTCLINYLAHEKYMQKHDLNIIPITQKKDCIIHISKK
jgi:hypothetical protein